MSQEIQFDLTPKDPSFKISRDLVLVTLNPYFTEYLSEIDTNVRPLELNLMNLKSKKNIFGNLKYHYYKLNENWDFELKDFSYHFEQKYPDVEQVYVFSECNAHNDYHFINSEGESKTLEDLSASRAINLAISNILFKKMLILPCFGKKEGTYFTSEKDFTSDIEISKIIKRSLEFHSY
jgi:hypothetical protein